MTVLASRVAVKHYRIPRQEWVLWETREPGPAGSAYFQGNQVAFQKNSYEKALFPPSFPGTITEYPSCAGWAEAGRRKRQVLLKALLSYLVPYEETEHTSLSEVLKIKEGDFFKDPKK